MMTHTQRMCTAMVFSIATTVTAAAAPQARGEGGTQPAAPAPTQTAQPPASSGAQPVRPPERAQPRPGVQVPPKTPAPWTPPGPVAVPPPPGYVIGPDDVLSIVYWRDTDMTTEVQVRPDGKIALSLINDVDAAGLTPEQLREKLVEASKEYFEDPNITVIVKTINSRKVYIMGQVAKQGPYPLTVPTTVMQLISLAGGLGEYANSDNIRVLRTENGRQMAYRVNYKDLRSGKKLQQNIELKPGDTVIVP